MFARGHGKSSAGVAGPPGGGQRSAKICARPEGCRPVAGTPAAAQAGGAGTGSTPLPVRNRRDAMTCERLAGTGGGTGLLS
jgi:hypothetical protein